MKPTILFLFLIIALSTRAQISTDGTVGPSLNLDGPNYQITSDWGQPQGGNLFHSFQEFNLKNFESATFSGEINIQNIISRVTGGNPSNINGTLRSTLPNADMYFINPAGIMFGPNASLDIPGSLYISTADYLRLGNNGRFDATEPANSLLTTAPPAAFGFLDNQIGNLEIKGNKENLLMTEYGKTLSFIGGNINIKDGHLFAMDGKIQLASLASPGEVPIDLTRLSDNISSKLGQIMITDSTEGTDNQKRDIANIDTSGFGGGEIFIQAGQLILDNGYLFADTLGTQNGQGITIEVTNDMILKNAARITTNAAIQYFIKTEEVTGEILEYRYFPSTGNAGNISISANQIHLEEGSQINSGSSLPLQDEHGNILVTPKGNAGNISITTEKLSIEGFNTTIFEDGKPLSSAIFSSTSSSSKSSHGGKIDITTNELGMDDLAEIRSETIGFGDAGNISVKANTMILKGGSQIIAGTGDVKHSQGDGLGGNIVIQVDKSTFITGQQEIFLDEKQQTKHSGFLSNTFTEGNGGTIAVFTPQLTLQNNGVIQTASRGNGDAGNIHLQINDITLHNGIITTQAEKAAGGDMMIQVNNRLDLFSSQITAEAEGDNARDHGGNLTIAQPTFMILNKSNIFTRGYAGNGGNINIIADQFLQSSDSLLDASSKLGTDGEIEIDAPETNIGEDVVILPKQFVTPKLPNWCETQLRNDKNSSRFRKVNWTGIPRDELKGGVLGSFLDLE